MVGEAGESFPTSEALRLLLGLRGFEGAAACNVSDCCSETGEGAASAMGEGAADGAGDAAARRRALAMRL